MRIISGGRLRRRARLDDMDHNALWMDVLGYASHTKSTGDDDNERFRRGFSLGLLGRELVFSVMFFV